MVLIALIFIGSSLQCPHGQDLVRHDQAGTKKAKCIAFNAQVNGCYTNCSYAQWPLPDLNGKVRHTWGCCCNKNTHHNNHNGTCNILRKHKRRMRHFR